MIGGGIPTLKPPPKDSRHLLRPPSRLGSFLKGSSRDPHTGRRVLPALGDRHVEGRRHLSDKKGPPEDRLTHSLMRGDHRRLVAKHRPGEHLINGPESSTKKCSRRALSKPFGRDPSHGFRNSMSAMNFACRHWDPAIVPAGPASFRGRPETFEIDAAACAGRQRRSGFPGDVTPEDSSTSNWN